MVHFDDGGDAFGGTDPEDRNTRGIGNRIAIERNHLEFVAGKSEAADLGGAPVQDMEENALALLYANGFGVAEFAAVDGERTVADFVAFRHSFRERRFHRRFTLFFEGLHRSAGREDVLGHVAAAAERWLEFLEDEEDFTIVVAGFATTLDIDGSDLAAVLTGREIGARAVVRVIEAETRRLRDERDSAHSMRGDEGSSFFSGAVDVGGDELDVPVEFLRRGGVLV